VRDASKSVRPVDNKCQGNGCDEQAVQRGSVSGLFLCTSCRSFEKTYKISSNGPERAVHIQERAAEKAASLSKGEICQGDECSNPSVCGGRYRRGKISKLYLCNPCVRFEARAMVSINSPDGIAWQLEQNDENQ
jgi:hypothetical protein